MKTEGQGPHDGASPGRFPSFNADGRVWKSLVSRRSGGAPRRTGGPGRDLATLLAGGDDHARSPGLTSVIAEM